MKNKTVWRKLFSRQTIFAAIFAASILVVVFTSVHHPSSAVEKGADWEYGGESNPTQWNKLSPEFKSCRFGDSQSPINIEAYREGNEEGESAEIQIEYEPGTAEVVNDGHTITVNYESESKLTIGEEEYKLVQFHFHTPSEHTIDNQASAMVIHFVHENEAGQLAVVGVMMNSGTENPIIGKIWDAIPEGKKANKTSTVAVDATALLPKSRSYISYSGSLTTPPCSEGVSWNLLLEPIELSAEQIETFQDIYPYNARPIQPINDRPIEFHRGDAVAE